MIVLVTGGRDFADQASLSRALGILRSRVQRGFGLCVVSGAAPGADTLASWWAIGAGTDGSIPRVFLKEFPADWVLLHYCKGHAHGRNGAGHCRNQRMVDWVVAQPSMDKLVLACPGGRGTADCVARARAANLTVKTLDEVLSEKP